MGTLHTQLQKIKDNALLTIRDAVLNQDKYTRLFWEPANAVNKDTDELYEDFINSVPLLYISLENDDTFQDCYPLSVYGNHLSPYLELVDEHGELHNLDILEKLDTETLLSLAEWLMQEPVDGQETKIEGDKNTLPKGIEIVVPNTGETFIGVEVSPIKQDSESCQRCEPDEADFWSAYLRMTDGTVICVADCEKREQAELLGKLMKLCLKQPSTNSTPRV